MRWKEVCHEGDHISATGQRGVKLGGIQTPQVDLMGSRNLSEPQERAGPDVQALFQGLWCQTTAFRFAAAPVWQHLSLFHE